MNVLVTGGTGFVGSEIVRQLRVSGHRIQLLTRSPNSNRVQEFAAQFGARVCPGDVLEPASLPEACAGVDAVIHLVGIISELGEQTFENIHTRGTRNIIFAAQDANVRRFVHISALGTRADARSRYHQSKWEAEERVRRSGLGWTIFRPSIIYGPGDGFVNLFARISRWSPIVPVIGDGKTKFQPVPVKSVGSAFVQALTEPRAVGETYDLCGAETLSLNELIDQILAATARKRLKLHLPVGVAHAQAAFLEFLFPRILREPSPLTRDQVLMLQEDNCGNPQPANEMFKLAVVLFAEEIRKFLPRPC
jgi:uncharacterized protein YbjT (DUF2867 family)